MENLRKSNGVTLVVLVVTIIVLLILAGVSISVISGENGLVTKSKRIRSNIEQAEIEGQTKINNLKDADYTEDGTIILNDENAPTIHSMEVTNITENSIKVSVNVSETVSGLAKIEYSIDDGEHYTTPNNNQARTYTFTDLKIGYEEYKVKVKVTDVNNNSSYASKTIESIKIGDYVNYTYNTVSEGYSLTSAVSGYTKDQVIPQPATALKWRVLNINEDRSIDLISETPTDKIVYFNGALGYNNGVYALNDICEKLFSNISLGIKARSINIEDIEKQETMDGKAARLAYNSGSAVYGKTKTYTGVNSYYPNLYAYENGSGINTTVVKTNGIGGSEKTANGYTMPTKETVSQATTGGLTVTQTGYYGIPFNNTNYGEAGAVLTASSYYWIASRYISCDVSYAGFGLLNAVNTVDYDNLCYSENTMNDKTYRLRPVVSLEIEPINVSVGKDESGIWQLKTR